MIESPIGRSVPRIGGPCAGGPTVSACSNQAIALRRRRVRDPLVACIDPIEFARRSIRNCGRLREAASPRTGRRHRHRGHRRDEHAGGRCCTRCPSPASSQFWTCRAGRSSNQPVPARPRYRSAVPDRWYICRNRRISRIWLPLHARRSRRRAAQYDFIKDLPELADTPVPFLPKQYVARTLGLSASFDAGRGCPYQCSFCTIINVQGRKSRFRSADDIEHLIRLNWAQGIHKFFITDDNFARNREWEPIFDRLILLRERDAIPLGLMIQVDTLCHKIPNFIEKAKRAGVTRVFIGLENINPDNLAGAKKRQNKITEYRRMLLAWKAQGIITLAGYILGFPSDTAETIRRDIAIIQEELPLDIVEFFCLTPLPGSEDHQILWKKGVVMDTDLNRYDVEHVCTGHARMSREQWEAIYRESWSLYYTPKHMETLLRRAVATGVPVNSLIKVLVNFATAVWLENVHPLQGGILRLKHPSERRPGLPRERAFIFWSRF